MKTNSIQKMTGWMLGVVLLGTTGAWAQGAPLVQVNVGESVIIKVEDVAKLAIADPAIADVAPLTATELSVIGKKMGATTLIVVHPEDAEDPTKTKPSTVYRVEVGNETILSTIRSAITPASVNVRMIGDTLVLEGQVNDEIELQRAEQIAKAFKPQVVNLAEVRSPRQIKIRVRVAEVSTDAVRRIGLKWLGDAGQIRYGWQWDPISVRSWDQFKDSVFKNVTHGLIGYDVNEGTFNEIGGAVSMDVLLQFFEQKGWARLLSEPTLLTRSGTEASFLAGSEIPIVQTLNNTSSVEYKEVGVRMKIKPVADSSNRINTTINAEVSQISGAFVRGGDGGELPVILSRKASTTLQLNDGQTMVIGGLLDNNIDTDTMRKFPWLGDIPIIGALFRHKDKSGSQRELVFFLTPSVVKDPAEEVSGATRAPALKDWNEQEGNKGVLELPNPKDDWGLHNPNGWGLPEPQTEGGSEPVATPMPKEPTKNFTPARPVAP